MKIKTKEISRSGDFLFMCETSYVRKYEQYEITKLVMYESTNSTKLHNYIMYSFRSFVISKVRIYK